MELFIGEIRLVPFDFPPRGWMFCDGSTLPIVQNQALFSLLGSAYGGDGQTTFAVPDLRGRVPIGAGQREGGSSYPLGATGGQETIGRPGGGEEHANGQPYLSLNYIIALEGNYPSRN